MISANSPIRVETIYMAPKNTLHLRDFLTFSPSIDGSV